MSLSPRTTVPPPRLSITCNWPGPVRATPVPIVAIEGHGRPLASNVAHVAGGVPTVMVARHCSTANPVLAGAGLECPAGEVEGGRAESAPW